MKALGPPPIPSPPPCSKDEKIKNHKVTCFCGFGGIIASTCGQSARIQENQEVNEMTVKIRRALGALATGLLLGESFAADPAELDQDTVRYFDTNGATPGFGEATGDWCDGAAVWSGDPAGASETTAVLPMGTAAFGTVDIPITPGEVSVYGLRSVGSIFVSMLGDSPLTFVAGDDSGTLEFSELHSVEGDTVFDVPVHSSEDFHVVASELPLEYSDSFLSKDLKLIFPGRQLADWEPGTCVLAGKSISECTSIARLVNRSESEVSVQYQSLEGTNLKGVKVVFVQTEQGIAAKAIWARYLANGALGIDMDVSFSREMTVATGPQDLHYGVKSVRMYSNIQAGVADFSEGLAVDGVLKVDPATKVIVRKELVVDSVTSESYDVCGVLNVRDVDANVQFSGALAGTGGTVEFGPFNEPENDSVVTVSKSFDNQSGPILLAVAKSVYDLVRVENGVGYGGELDKKTAALFFFERNGNEATFQSQIVNGQYLTCAMVRIFQRGTDVYGEVTMCPYVLSSDYELGVDFRTITPIGTDCYGLSKIGLVFRNRPIARLKAQAFSQNNFTVEVNNARMDVLHNFALSDDTTVNIHSGGHVRLQHYWRRAQFNVHSGGILEPVYATWSTGSRIVVDGGRLQAPAERSVEPSIKDIVLRNGGSVGGCGLLMLGQDSVVVSVEGFSPSYWECGMMLKGDKDGISVTFDVQDVTGDDRVDFFHGGDIFDQSGYPKVQLIKQGEGTMRLDNKCTGALQHPVKLAAGTLLLGVDSALSTGHAVDFAGGTLAVAENTQQVLSSPVLSDDSVLAVGKGATISFADSSATAWSAGKTLNITCDKPSQVRFGTSATALTASQVKALRVNGKKVVLDDSGHLASRGMVLLLF